MTKLEELGKVYTTDVLIIGAGNSGIAAAHRVKDAGLDALVIDRCPIGYNGQSTRAGHGLAILGPDDDVEHFIEEQVRHNPFGSYLNDQDVLRALSEDLKTYHYELQKYGAVLALEEDGSIHHHREFEGKAVSSCNLDLDFIVPMTKYAMKRGVRMMERVYFTDLLTDGDRVIGAVGFDMDTLEFLIFRAKAVVNAANGMNFCPGGMFMSGADAMIACYDVGAEFRNAEQCTYIDLEKRNTKEYIYGMHCFMYNKDGENLSEKYAPGEYEDVTPQLVLGMIEEVKAGKSPLYIDYTKAAGMTEGTGFNQGQLFPKRLEMYGWIRKDDVPSPTTEVSVDIKYVGAGVRVDPEIKTNVPGLYAPGSISIYGCAYGGWVHGDGVGYANRSGLRAGTFASAYAKTIDDLGTVDIDAVKAIKERIYAPMKRKEGILPSQIIEELASIICLPEYSIAKTEASMHECLEKIGVLKKKLETEVYVPDGDGHYLGKYNEARTDFILMEITLKACLARKESRGPAIRADFPTRDDKNMLKWVIVTKGEDGEPDVHYERIPFERYKYRPEGWTPDAVNA